ncbi:acyl-CoA Delta-9 desaturase-like [Macrosteles quadrilineatus]|uniref:acyl-CoA Delta-9 desaturase-like n=1 Tax=Macrosteles quadrilineatus TaxID=74068 RepID=UPI0023E20291|nr:acyl-CoA Delta-9 desaturase-like [Macrosteles quadrilineatus]XP_054266124.1 acyl-CoA Delta-9 desaturase-like [Macrosteles quadrilineatus]XP_054266125.1 acyl-CoA Delta-9 desaturase-like [Macrosteles quadrilineatus]XP_054266126.1 acyl-CoA Delta-9 desaturase-like [Macrosteles quadrilineatus]
MAPNVTGSPTSLFLAGAEICPEQKIVPEKLRIKSVPTPAPTTTPAAPKSEYHWEIVWRNVAAFIYLHGAAVYGLLLLLTGRVHPLTLLFSMSVGFVCGLGITAGAHRLWAHKAYKAKWPLRLLLAFFQTVAFQNHIYEWVRDHRVHHKFTDTNADPHNSRRGFFFSHMGWLMVRKHKDVIVRGKTVDMTDLEKDWVVVWQRRLYLLLLPICCFALPTWIPMHFWGESFWTAWNLNILRYTLSLNGTWLVNSAAHIWGMKPYDRTISPTENASVALLALGEGWHNYHHAFPWDYKAAELGNYTLNFTTMFLDVCARLGLAYDLKKASDELVRKRILRTGDGSHKISHEHSHEGEVWGWGDKDMDESEKDLVDVVNPAKEE